MQAPYHLIENAPPLDGGLACETVYETTGKVATGSAFATICRLLVTCRAQDTREQNLSPRRLTSARLRPRPMGSALRQFHCYLGYVLAGFLGDGKSGELASLIIRFHDRRLPSPCLRFLTMFLGISVSMQIRSIAVDELRC